jgi:hypothetical protein
MAAIVGCLIMFCWTADTRAQNRANVIQCGQLSTADTTYVLQNDVVASGTCFEINASDVTLDLNSHTITYDAWPSSFRSNADFEIGSGNIPEGWDLSEAPGVERRPTSELAMVNHWYLYWGNAPDRTAIASSWIPLPPSHSAVAYMLRGDKTWAYREAPVWRIIVECDDGTAVLTQDFTEDVSFPFTTRPVSARYRLKLILLDGKGLVLNQYGIYPSFDLIDLRQARNYGIVINYKNNVAIKNGRIIQGSGGTFQGHSIYHYSGSGLTVSNVTIETNGTEASSIYSNYVSNVKIEHCNITNRNPYVLHRSQLSAAVAAHSGTNIKIFNNTVDSGSGWGCVNTNKDEVEIAFNQLRTSSTVTNHHAIVVSGEGVSNIRVHDNTIDANPGQGIFAAPNGGQINGNVINIHSTAPNFEYGYYSVDAITLKDYNNQYCKNVIIDNNRINLYGAYDHYFTGYSGKRIINGIMNMCTGGNVRFTNNRITGRSVDPEVAVIGMEPGGKFDTEVLIANNRFESDIAAISFGGYAGQGDVASNLKFQHNEFVRGPTAGADYHTIWLDRAGNLTTDKTQFLGNLFSNGSSPIDVRLAEYGQFQYYVGWYLNVTVRDAAGNGLPGINVAVKDLTGATVYTGTTNAGGQVRNIAINELKNAGSGVKETMTVTRYSPHTVVITLPDGTKAAESIYMGGSKELIYQMQKSTIVKDIPDGISTAKPIAPHLH